MDNSHRRILNSFPLQPRPQTQPHHDQVPLHTTYIREPYFDYQGRFFLAKRYIDDQARQAGYWEFAPSLPHEYTGEADLIAWHHGFWRPEDVINAHRMKVTNTDAIFVVWKPGRVDTTQGLGRNNVRTHVAEIYARRRALRPNENPDATFPVYTGTSRPSAEISLPHFRQAIPQLRKVEPAVHSQYRQSEALDDMFSTPTELQCPFDEHGHERGNITPNVSMRTPDRPIQSLQYALSQPLLQSQPSDPSIPTALPLALPPHRDYSSISDEQCRRLSFNHGQTSASRPRAQENANRKRQRPVHQVLKAQAVPRRLLSPFHSPGAEKEDRGGSRIETDRKRARVTFADPAR